MPDPSPWRHLDRTLREMTMHPFATLKTISHLNKLPDRRVSLRPRNRGQQFNGPDPLDPIRGADASSAYFKAIGVYAFEDTRPDLCAQYFEMDFDALIAQVIDAFATEASQVDYERRRVVWCESNNSDIQRIVTRTLDRLKIDYRAFPIMRSLARDGDVFMHSYGAPNEGIVAIKPYKPFQVARLEDSIGRLLGFSPADEQGNPTATDTRSIQAYQALHFRLPPRDLEDVYGVESSFLWGARVLWRELQLMLDQVVLQRLLRRPDRLAILLDTTGLSTDEAYEACKDMERRMYHETYTNVATGQFHSHGALPDLAQDVVIPRGNGNDSSVTNFPATNTNDLLRDVNLLLSMLAASVGFPLGMVGQGDPGNYNPAQTISRQSQPFAKKCGRLQQAFLQELVRMCMIDLGWNSIDPFEAQNAFSLHMASVAPIVEMERNEVLQLRMDRMDRGVKFGADTGLNQAVWVPYVLEFWGGLPRDLIKQIYPEAQIGVLGMSTAATDTASESKHPPAPPDRRVIEEALMASLGTPSDSHPLHDSTMFSPRDVFDRSLCEGVADGSGKKQVQSGDRMGRAPADPVALTESFNVKVGDKEYKGSRPAEDKEFRKKMRMRSISRIDVMAKIAKRVLAPT